MKIQQFASLLSVRAIRVAAISTLAIGAATVVSTVPAGAVAITTGSLTFSGANGGTSDFFDGVNPVSGNTFDVIFNPLVSAKATGEFIPYFTLPANQNYPIPPVTGSFLYNGLLDGQQTYRLTSGPLAFAFGGTSTTLSLNANSIFGLTDNASGRTLSTIGGQLGTIRNTDITDNTVVARQAVFSFTDIQASGGGGFTGTFSPTAVPEPFTIIGTIIGGTAAFRMRKKLSSSAKNAKN